MRQSCSEGTSGNRIPPRSRDDKKGTSADTSGTNKQKEETMDVKSSAADDVYEFKSDAASGNTSPDLKQSGAAGGSATEAEAGSADSSVGTTATQGGDDSTNQSGTTKRTFAEISGDNNEELSGTAGQNTPAPSSSGNDEESKRKKRKDETAKEGKSGTQRSTGQGKGQNSKQSSAAQNKSGSSGSLKSNADKKSPCSSPKPVSDAETEDGKTDLKVPPLKIVIPQTTSSEQEGTTGRNSKSSSQRSQHALPYVVASSGGGNGDSSDKDQSATFTSEGATTGASKSNEEKKEASGTSDEPQSHTETDPQQPSTTSTTSTASTTTSSTSTSASTSVSTTSPATTSATTSSSSASAPAAAPVELHPRKRKMKQNKEQANAAATGSGSAAGSASQAEQPEPPQEVQIHPHDQPITNCYQLFLNIRKQIAKRRRGLFPVQPKPPQGFKDYLMNRCTYVLAGSRPTTPNINYPQNLPPPIKDLFTEQEKERYRLRTQHVIEKEKLVLSVEQEILRVHGRAARALANQSLPFSVCTILRDEEVYNLITPEQEEKDRNARSRYNGRLFLSWLQDVDDKWEKIKEHMLLRHHNEAESLHAVQKMDWEWKMKELSLCDRKSTPKIEDTHVPMVHVSDDFDLLPA
ncbi:unnamed protein product [Acanthoscelides obtectus]|uniref:Ankyrin repeat domain-containing protein 12 n=2 Tax=Acanthoscelides obtectus TaxID=200917 RepID=A0A9P0MAR3_ACAOB|nr:unnamed protein product [Acanthoscelides obtectus]CAH2010480.1 unnamed protein product [Acanthoscelides obtectus]CAK1646546.1 Ankyrin repeat domain-containing protein 11 [Acanthoscelides obtectus]CAK1646585.1 Ankyrin repeat domain-containing protein 11 [Acanthoscelides obtectus]